MSSESSPSPSSRKRNRSRSPRRSSSPASSNSSSPPRSSPSDDPDGPPAVLRDMLLKKPGIIGSIEKLMDDAARRGHARCPLEEGGSSGVAANQAMPAPPNSPPPPNILPRQQQQGGSNAVLGNQSMPPPRSLPPAYPANSVKKPPLDPSSRIPVELKGKAVIHCGATDLEPKAPACPSPPGSGGAPSAHVAVERCPVAARAQSTGAAVVPRSATTAALPFVPNRPCSMTRRPAMEPLMLNRGRSFVKHFTLPFKQAIEIPIEFWLRIPNRNSGTVIIFGDAMMGFEVRVETVNGKCMFTEGWADFIAAERVSRNDIGVFASLFSNTIGMRLYGVTGAERPLSRRPPLGHPMLLDWPAIAPQDGADLPNIAIPNNLLDMVFELGAGVVMNGPIMQMIANVWYNVVSDHPLYVCMITRSQIGPRAQFFFSKRFSRYLNHGTPTVLLVGGSAVGYPAVLVRHARNPDVARITTGWNIFAAIAAFEAGQAYVVRVLETNSGTYQIRFYFCGGPFH